MLVELGPVKIITPKRYVDDRGWFSETWSEAALRQSGLECRFVQDNHSYSRQAGTIRGIHFQAPPYGQAKLVRCVRGRIIDFAVDLRAGSPTYGAHVAEEITAENGRQMFVPVGFGHAFVTLTPDVEVIYKCSSTYSPAHEGGVVWNDSELAIDWPVEAAAAVLSEKDSQLPTLAEFESPFTYDGVPLQSAGTSIEKHS